MAQNYDDFLKQVLEEVQLSDVLDVDAVQEMQDVMARSLQLSALMTTLDGTYITRQSNVSVFCRDYMCKTMEGRKQCEKEITDFSKSLEGSVSVVNCVTGNFLEGYVPIKIKDRHVANWLFGQVRDEQDSLSEEQIRDKARRLGVDEDEMIVEYANVPAVSRGRFDDIFHLFQIMGGQISESLYQTCVAMAEEKYREALTAELNAKKEEAEYANSIDELTQLYNRNYFEKQCEQFDFLGITPFAVVMGDVNHLKLTNDIFGHRHGDYLLRKIADVMKEEAFDGYVICRCGGDEFNVLMPNANRSEAEWFCHRVHLELEKCVDCCVKPSIAFGVGKKSHKEERIKDIIDFADVKMYKAKSEMKAKQDILADMQNVLLGRGFLSSEYQTAVVAMARKFGEYLQFDAKFVKNLTRLVRVQDFGYMPVTKELFLQRFDEDKTLEQIRELNKHPLLGSKIVELNESYANLSEFILAHEEQWDGKGYPNELSGEEIPLMSRLSKIIGDYHSYITAPPIGMGKSKDEAYQMMVDGLGNKYDPVYGRKFLSFLDLK